MISLFFTHSVFRFLQFVCIGVLGRTEGKLNLFYTHSKSVVDLETHAFMTSSWTGRNFVVFAGWNLKRSLSSICIELRGRRVSAALKSQKASCISNELYFMHSTVIREMFESKRLVSQSEYVAMRTPADHCSVDCIKTKEHKIDILNIQGT